jgi:hypothetical protein
VSGAMIQEYPIWLVDRHISSVSPCRHRLGASSLRAPYGGIRVKFACADINSTGVRARWVLYVRASQQCSFAVDLPT